MIRNIFGYVMLAAFIASTAPIYWISREAKPQSAATQIALDPIIVFNVAT